ncbi:hypothetical protein [Burkholderia sp. LMG 32019]|uniref:hypothetical protein n=1 Tax=Burkholderia sp. LMG 32019 TaxID=3158173 RepID=UPI003C2D7178
MANATTPGQLKRAICALLTIAPVVAAIDAAVLGVGLIRVLSYQVAQALRDRTLDVVLDTFESQPLPVSLVHKGQAPMPLKLRAFLDFVAPRLRERIAGLAPGG